MNHFGYSEQLSKLFRLKKSENILDSFTDAGTKARMIERFGGMDRLLQDKPCVYDEYGELIDISGTGFDSEYDAEVLMMNDGQLMLL